VNLVPLEFRVFLWQLLGSRRSAWGKVSAEFAADAPARKCLRV